MSIEISPKSFFQQPSVADMRLIACPGAEELTGLIDKHLVRWVETTVPLLVQLSITSVGQLSTI